MLAPRSEWPLNATDVDRVLAVRRAQATQRDVRLIEQLAPAVTTSDSRLIESLVANLNLADNAIRHNVNGGYIQIVTETTAHHASVTIANSGPIAPDDQVERLFQPFQRISASRGDHHDGLGLGLAIVDGVTRAHHATLTARAQPNGGLRLEVRFRTSPQRPSASPPDPGIPFRRTN